jgi:hypothetical protein
MSILRDNVGDKANGSAGIASLLSLLGLGDLLTISLLEPLSHCVDLLAGGLSDSGVVLGVATRVVDTEEFFESNSVLVFQDVTDLFESLKGLIRVEHNQVRENFGNVGEQVTGTGFGGMLFLKHVHDLGLFLDNLAVGGGWDRPGSVVTCFIRFHF